MDSESEIYTKLYRAVGVEEYLSIVRNKCFTIHPDGLGAEVKYFGNDFDETLKFVNSALGKSYVAIFEVSIQKSIVNAIDDKTPVDATIFKSGTVVIQSGDLDFFNKNIHCILHKL